MRCFYHSKEDAVGMCKVCNKALCGSCAVEVDGFVFCKTHAKMKKAVVHAEKEALGEEDELEVEEEDEEVFSPPQKQRSASSAQAARLSAIRKIRREPQAYYPEPRQPKIQFDIPLRTTITPAIVGAIIGGTITGFPFINLLFPIWITIGGACSAYLLLLKVSSEKHLQGYATPKTGALVGALSGSFASFIALSLNVFSAVMFSDVIKSTVQSIVRDPTLSFYIMEIVMTEENLYIVSFLWRFIAMWILFPIFGALGGLIVARLTR